MATSPDAPQPPRVDPRAVVSPEAVLGEGVEIGPFAVVEAGVVIGARTRIWAHAYVCSGTTLGSDNAVHMNAVIGHEPQDKGYSGAPTRIEIGDRNVIREGCQLHRGTAPGSATVIGSDCYFMGNAHVAHNCRVGDGVVLANNTALGGHASVAERAFLSANVLIHQHTRVGRLAMLQGGTAVSQDVPPFCLTRLGTNALAGINAVGLRRAGFDRTRSAAIRRAFRTLFASRSNLRAARERLLEEESARGGVTADVQEMLDFIAAAKHGVCVVRGPVDSEVADDS
jgi:UDP-N-acetylglucosamine acyltransferase